MEEKIPVSVFNLLVSAGDAILDIYQGHDFDIEIKPDNSPVTRADKISSRIMNKGLNLLFPDVPVIDEENVISAYETRKNWRRFFLADPLDGTKEFISKNGEFCINLALIQSGFPVEGCTAKAEKEFLNLIKAGRSKTLNFRQKPRKPSELLPAVRFSGGAKRN